MRPAILPLLATLAHPLRRCDSAASRMGEGLGVRARGVERAGARCELLEEIARGGMGVVYRARQVSLNRTVAVKMILAGQLASASDVQRFRAEAEAAAKLQHPNIVAIHEVGEHDGQHYFSMDFVEGKNLAQLVSDFGFRISEFRRAARWVKTIAEAIHYAHQRGVLHRDLKPSNVLIDPTDQPRITDFGLAKRLDVAQASSPASSGGVRAVRSEPGCGRPKNPQAETPALHNLTLTGQVLGSPNFMPPEQAAGKRGQIGPHIDVYSLGAILYHLLTARPPFLAETLTETLQQVQNADPISPRLLNPGVPRDLETICLKCLEKDRHQRYGTAQQLAEELERFLRDEPIRARPAGRIEKARRWCRRKPALAGALAACALVLMSGIAGITWQWHRAEQNAKREEQQRERAEQNAARSEQVAQFLKDMLKGVQPSVAEGRDTTMLREILDKTVERLGKDLKHQPGVEADLRNILGVVYRSLGENQKAEAMHREALAIRRKLLGADHQDVAESLDNLATVFADEGRYVEAEARSREALAIFRKVRGSQNSDVADCLNNLGEMLAGQGKHAEAAALHREALALRRKLLGNADPAVALSLNNLALALGFQGKSAEAEAMHREALAMYKNSLGSERPEVAKSLNNVALELVQQGKLAEAEGLLREALALNKKLLGNEHPDVAVSIDNLAATLDLQGKNEETETLYGQGLAMRRKLLGNEHPDVAISLANLAERLSKQAKYAEAEELAREALAVNKKLWGGDHPNVATSLHSLGSVLTKESKYKEAEERYRDALVMRKKVFGNEHPNVAVSLHSLANLLTTQNRLAEGENAYRDALTIARKAFANAPVRLEHYLTGLADNLCRQSKYAAADQLFDDFLPAGAEIQPQHVALLRGRGSLRGRRGRFAEAAADFTRVIEFKPDDYDAWHLLAALLVQNGQLDAYREHCRMSLERFRKTTDPLIATRMAKDCLILPDSGVELGAADAWAETSLTAGTNHPAWPALISTKGVAEYRQGRFAGAIDWMEKTLSYPKDSRAAWLDAETYAVLAMAHSQLKQIDEARSALARGAEIEQTKLPKLDSGDLGGGWVDWIIAHTLMNEARTLIDGGANRRQ